MDTMTIQVSPRLYEEIRQSASHQHQTPENFVVSVLSIHPYIEVVSSRSDPRPVVRGTQVGIDVIVGYAQASYNPQEIATEILPHLSLAQVYDALSYYEDHREYIDADMQIYTTEAWQKHLHQELGEKAEALLGS